MFKDLINVYKKRKKLLKEIKEWQNLTAQELAEKSLKERKIILSVPISYKETYDYKRMRRRIKEERKNKFNL